MVEMTGVEPVSESNLPRLSTGVAFPFKFPQRSAERQAQRFGSLCVMTGKKASPDSRSPLSDALFRAAVLPERTATYLIRLRTPSHSYRWC